MTELFLFPGLKPISANDYYVQTPYGRQIGAKGKAFKKKVISSITPQMQKRKVLGPVMVSYFFGQPNRVVRDVDNLVKHFQDAVKGLLFEDDQKICILEAMKICNADDFFTIVLVTPTIVQTPEEMVSYFHDSYPEAEKPVKKMLAAAKRKREDEEPVKKRK